MRNILYMHFQNREEEVKSGQKYQNIAMDYCNRKDEKLLVILEAVGANDKRGEDAIVKLLKENLIDKILFPNLKMIASDIDHLQLLLEELSKYSVEIKFLEI